VGRLSFEKGHDVLLRAFAQLRGRGCAARLVIVGDGPERGALEKLAAELGLGGDVLMPGYVPEMERHLRSFDLFVLPSRTEGSPVVLQEALRASLPIVATAVGGVPATLSDGRAGQLVPPEDTEALTEALVALATDAGRRLQLGAAARAAAEALPSTAGMARRYTAVYREVLGSQAA
jgi:glycosyltransferase involved in cell wall biosynthesis